MPYTNQWPNNYKYNWTYTNIFFIKCKCNSTYSLLNANATQPMLNYTIVKCKYNSTYIIKFKCETYPLNMHRTRGCKAPVSLTKATSIGVMMQEHANAMTRRSITVYFPTVLS